MKKKMIFMPFFFIGMAALVIWVLMLLWNWLIPELFGLDAITYWQSAGLLVIAKILFGGFHAGKRGCCCGSNKHQHHGWKHKFKHKWAAMSEEDKKRWEKKFAGTVYSGKCLDEAVDSKLNTEEQEE